MLTYRRERERATQRAGLLQLVEAVAHEPARARSRWAIRKRARPRSSDLLIVQRRRLAGYAGAVKATCFPRDGGRSLSRARFASRRESRCPHPRPEAALLHPPGDGGVRRRAAVARAARPSRQSALRLRRQPLRYAKAGASTGSRAGTRNRGYAQLFSRWRVENLVSTFPTKLAVIAGDPSSRPLVATTNVVMIPEACYWLGHFEG